MRSKNSYLESHSLIKKMEGKQPLFSCKIKKIMVEGQKA